MLFIKNKYIILGNGFSIDLMKRLGVSKEINLTNLFSGGDNVLFPKTNEKGFISAKHCPNLWTLGVSSNISTEESNQLINDIITCANVFNLSGKRNTTESDLNIYLKAYFELSSYLRRLFIHYNCMVSDERINGNAENIPLIKYIKQAIGENYQVNIITYNYDIWLERLLKACEIDFSINGFSQYKSIVDIYKPHGSISFSFKTKLAETAPYKIKFATDDIAQDVKDFDIIYDLKDDYPIVNSLIPPAGDSERYPFGWISTIRKNLSKCVEESRNEDELLIYGISYWHVDRNEIDDILINMNPDVDVKLVNPYPPSDFNAVLSSLFKNYIQYTDGTSIIKEVM